MTPKRRRTTWTRYAVTALTVAGAALAAAGCGGDDPGGGSAAQSPDAAATPGIAEARAMVEKATQRPTSVGIAEPVGKAVPKGKKLFFISCGVQACETQGKIIQQGAADLGWTATTIGTDGSPEKLQNAFNTALRQGADAVILNAADRATLSAQIAQAKQKGVAFVTCCSVDSTGDGILYNTSTPEQNATIGKYLAALVVADSKGAADTLYVNISAFRILESLGASFESSHKAYCPACGYASIDIPLTSLGKDAPDRIISYLRSHPKVNYVALSVSDALGAGLPAALQAAGLAGKVKIVGQGADSQTFQYVKGGQIAGVVPFDYYGVDYLMLDALARHFAGVPIPSTPPPLWIATKANAPAATDSVFPLVEGYRDEFRKLWGVVA